MNLTYVSSPRKNEQGEDYELYLLADLESERIYGYVEGPEPGQMSWLAVVYEGTVQHWYLSESAAKDWLESFITTQDILECESLDTTLSLTAKPDEATEKEECLNSALSPLKMPG